MTIQQYDELIASLETLAEENPRGYKLRVLGLAVGGYAYIAVVLALLLVGLGLAAMLLFVHIGLGIGLGVLVLITIWSTLRALWVPTPETEGRRLQRSEAPEFFSEIDRIRQEMNAPKIHEVIVLPEFNAAIRQVPRLGMLGWQKNFLFVGLPLMSFLTRDEFRAVVAHEFGHLSGRHNWFTSWIYRVRTTWSRLLQSFDTGERPSVLFGRFFSKFAPYFDAYTFVLARKHEYEADSASAALAGAQTAGRALIKTSIGGQFLSEEFWPEVGKLNDHREEPPRQLFVRMEEELVDCSRDDDAQVWLETALARNPGLSDTHPSLAQRLDALDVEAELPEPTEESAADVLLGDSRAELRREFNQQWYEQADMQWGYHYERAQEGLERLEELQALEEFDDDQEWELLLLRERFEDDDMLEEYQAFWAEHPEHDQAAFAVGRLLLDDEQDKGIEALEEAMSLNERLTLDVCQVVMGYLFHHGRRAEAQPWLDKYDVFYEKTREAQIERSYVESADELHQHHLDDEVVQSVVEQLAGMPGVREVYLVAKVVEHFPDSPLYVLGVLPESGRLLGGGDQALINQIAGSIQFPFEMLVYDLADSQNKFIKKAVARIENARLI